MICILEQKDDRCVVGAISLENNKFVVGRFVIKHPRVKIMFIINTIVDMFAALKKFSEDHAFFVLISTVLSLCLTTYLGLAANHNGTANIAVILMLVFAHWPTAHWSSKVIGESFTR